MRTPMLIATLLLSAGAAKADELLIPVDPSADFTQAIQTACAVRTSPACEDALSFVTARALAALSILSERRDPQVVPLARLAADAASADLRAAAAVALAAPFAGPEDTPILAELADDPVPAVRAAALRSLRSSNDPRAQALVRRADVYGSKPHEDQEALSDQPDAVPPAARLGVKLPADAVFLYFASDTEDGRYSYWTASAPAQVLAALKGKGPYTPEQFRAQTPGAKADKKQEEAEKAGEEDNPFANMPSAEDMERMMKMAEQMGKAAEQNQGKSQQEQAEAMAKAAKGMASFDADLANAYEETEVFTDAKMVVVDLADGTEAVVAVYRDPAVGDTGITVHRAPLGTP